MRPPLPGVQLVCPNACSVTLLGCLVASQTQHFQTPVLNLSSSPPHLLLPISAKAPGLLQGSGSLILPFPPLAHPLLSKFHWLYLQNLSLGRPGHTIPTKPPPSGTYLASLPPLHLNVTTLFKAARVIFPQCTTGNHRSPQSSPQTSIALRESPTPWHGQQGSARSVPPPPPPNLTFCTLPLAYCTPLILVSLPVLEYT